ncbi:ATP-binding cassette domain-containing protein [Litorivicinus lipolyticus]|uniref:ABC-type dipeptide transporter n=1 Tax=Litorivicinus lipolyticus TaxID=418701 RepID=A0A5Q2QAM9_9GAMM|nr:ABC transporter ATP-binding protein [Litorivicinus lipolyticus]QGG80084.1 ATP-binding cassette domain-containing protein [Litorivicinus lipolyticus]
MSVLRVEDLSVQFPSRRGTLTALDGVTFDLQAGEILGLVGESGAGKSMTGAALLGLLEPPGRISGGRIFFQDERVDLAPEAFRGHRIGMVFQDPLTSLNPLKTVGDQLIETLRWHRDLTGAQARREAGELLTEVGLDPSRLDAYPHEFSGGMRQRVVIALALAPRPAVLVADEPTTALDVSIQAQILELLKRLCRERGTAVILITHDMGVVAQTTDRVGVLYAGRLVEVGTTAQVINAPKHPYTRGLMASTPTLAGSVDQDLYQIPGSMPRLDQIPVGCAFNPRCEHVSERCLRERPRLDNGRACFWSEGT